MGDAEVMIPPTGRTLRPWVLDAARGALVGLAVFATWYVALRYTDSVIRPDSSDDGLAVLGASMVVFLKVGVPSTAVVGLLTSWAVRLERPWAVSFLGLFHTALVVLC